MTRSESIKELAAALAAAQAQIEGASKDKINPAFKTRYADLASVWEACRIPLSKNGLAVVQLPSADGQKVVVATLLAHRSGEWISDELTITATGLTPQAIGSAITYARRYALSAMVGVAPDDDSDGNQRQYVRTEPPPEPTYMRQAQPPPSQPPPSQPAPAQSAPTAPSSVPAGDGEAMAIARLLRDAKTPAELDVHLPRIKALPEAERDDLRPLYLARMKEMSEAPRAA
jgi:hypothetical protein